MNKKIAIIGMGHMGKALHQGLLNAGFAKEQIVVSNSSQENRKAVEKSDWIFITVKPHVAKTVIAEIADGVRDKIIISAACGLTIAKVASLSQNEKQKVIRIMPNLPVAYKQGVIGVYANKHVIKNERAEVLVCLSQLGSVIECKREDELDAITVLSGSGPAVVSYFISMLAASGKSFGLTNDVSQTLALHTFIGTLTLLQKTNQTPQELQSSVATKGGTTEEIINSLDKENTQKLFVESLGKGYDRIKKLKEEL